MCTTLKRDGRPRGLAAVRGTGKPRTPHAPNVPERLIHTADPARDA